jgi:hypothetical protein
MRSRGKKVFARWGGSEPILALDLFRRAIAGSFLRAPAHKSCCGLVLTANSNQDSANIYNNFVDFVFQTE